MEKIICTVTNDLSYDQRMIRICSSLSRAGYQVVLVGRERPSSRPLIKQAFGQHRLACRFESGKLFYIEYNIRLLLWLWRQPFDALCAVDLDTLLPGFLASRFRRKPLVYDAHEYFTETPEVVRRPFIRKAWSLLAYACLPRLQYAYTVGPRLARLLAARYRLPFAVIRNMPFRQTAVEAMPKAEPPVLLYQGALNEGRGLEACLKAMQQLEGVQLWLAGEGDLSETLRQMALDLGVSHKVRFLGFLRPAQLRTLTPQAFLGLNLLENKGLSYYYSLANKAFDYIQAGLPAIHMNFPEYRSLHKAYPAFELLETLNADAIAGLVRELLNQPERYREMQRQCQAAAKVWNWEIEEERLLRFWRAVFKATARRRQ